MFRQRKFRNFRRSRFSRCNAKPQQPLKLGSLQLDGLMLNGIMLALIVFVGLSYLLVINQTSVGGFEIKELERANEEMRNQGRQLELVRAEMYSLAAIEEASKDFELVTATNIEYLPAVGSIVAVK